ncbi:MAG TPA: hypothetical protein VJI46_00485 [Candidatus Nanoarchaeia archaeon]|nr:hypothetical protein [Candidatus Nanoarchaeia archaeon]
MEQTVKTDILATLDDVLKILQEKPINTSALKELSNHTIHNASIYQDEDSVSIAILIYAISKILERGLDEKYRAQLVALLKEAYNSLDSEQFGEYKSTIKRIFGEITRMETKFKRYIEEVIRQAQIRKGSKIFEHGISIARASEMLGVSQWELMSYVGKTSLTDIGAAEEMTKKRLSFARGLFK